MIDLRSDTVTAPSPGMRRAMADAEVGDDVYHDDPTVNRLEEMVASLLGTDDAVYVPTGTMANQLAVRAQTEPGDLVVTEASAHVSSDEVGAAAALAGVTITRLPGRRGIFTAAQLTAAVPAPPPSLPLHQHQPVRLVAVENTHNDGGGVVWPLATLREVTDAADSLGIASHLDGARLWNAAVASDTDEETLAAGFDTVSVCFSKGLGAPVGSALAGSTETTKRVRRFKQMYGGGFRQAGVIAAGAIYGIEHHRERLAFDHANARRFAEAINEVPGVTVDLGSVETNIVYFGMDDADTAVERCARNGVAILATEPARARAVFHLDVDERDTDRAIERATTGLSEC